MAELYRHHAFERSLAVTPFKSHPDHFTSVYGPWGYPRMTRVAGSVPLAEGTGAAYKTVPADFALHCLQSHFLKPGLVGVPLQHGVQRLMTTSSFASRNVIVKQRQGDEMVVTAVLILSFVRRGLADTRGVPARHEFTLPPSEATAAAAKQQIDPEHDEFNGHVSLNVPEGTPYPPFSSQRLHVSQEADVTVRVQRSKLRTQSPLSGPAGQILAVVYFSDFFVVDAPLVARDIDFGIPRVGDKSRTFTPNQLRQFASLTHNLRFVKLDGFDAHEGVLLEVSTRWFKGRRGVSTIVMRDCRGELIATGEQEVSLCCFSGA